MDEELGKKKWIFHCNFTDYTTSILRWHGSLSAKVNKNANSWVTVMTGVSPSFRVGVSFKDNLSLPNFKLGFSSSLIMNPKLLLDGHIYTLTAGRFLNTNVFQINLG